MHIQSNADPVPCIYRVDRHNYLCRLFFPENADRFAIGFVTQTVLVHQSYFLCHCKQQLFFLGKYIRRLAPHADEEQ
jgi:hypothetical protein